MIHQITATWAFNEANKREEQRRDECPKCGEKIASEARENEALQCAKCGAPDAGQAQEEHEEAKK